MALTAAELAFWDIAAAAASNDIGIEKAADSHSVADQTLHAAKKAAVETLDVAKKAASQTLLVAKQEAQKTLAVAKAMVISINQELVLLHQALNSISQAVLITDDKRRTTYINDAFEQLCPFTRSRNRSRDRQRVKSRPQCWSILSL
jgi:PAS domain-containing protein